jgi:hypothetical protein
VRPQHLAQRGVQQVRGGVIAPRGIAQRRGHFARSVSPTRSARATMRCTVSPGTPGNTDSTSATLFAARE